MMGSYLPNAQQTLGTSWQYHGLDYTTENISSDFLFTLKRDTSQKKKTNNKTEHEIVWAQR